MFRLSRILTVAALTIGSLSPLSFFSARAAGPLIKGTTSSAVYYVTDGKRYAFPTEQVFKSWYADFSTVATVPDTELASYALAGNVTYRPGTRLIKIATDPKVYAVSRYGVLRWVMTENAAMQIYGSDWKKKVDDIADAFFTNYLVGSNVGADADYNLNDELGVATIVQNIPSPGYKAPVPPTSPSPPAAKTGTVAVSISSSQATLNQMLLVVATVADSPQPITKIDIFSNAQTAPHKTCQNSTTCSFMYTVAQAPLDIRFKATATTDQGAKIETPFELQARLDVAAVSSDITISALPLDITAGSRVNYASNASTFSGITSHRLFIVIPGEPNPILWKDCEVTPHCASSSPLYRTSQFFSKVTTGGQTHQSASVTVSVTGGTAPKPMLTLLSKPQANQAVLKLDAPSGETIGWSTIVEGTDPDNNALALCEYSSCEVTMQFNKITTYTAFTNVGGKLEASNSVTVSP